jgi:flagellar protein FlbD
VFALNPDLIERADATPDTVITLIDGTKYIVTESVAELVGLIRQYRASVIHEARTLALPVTRPSPAASGEPPAASPAAITVAAGDTTGEVVQLHRREC